MTTTSATYTETTLDVAGTKLLVVRGGTGAPLLVLHDEMGHQGWLRVHEALAAERTLIIPSHPGFPGSDRLDWVMTVRDLACWYLQALDDLGLDGVDLLGFSMGAWLAAEMAAINPRRFRKLVLVSAMGIKPPTGEIFDMFVVTAKQYIDETFADAASVPEYESLYGGEISPEKREAWEAAREQACRLTWRPYMFDPALPYLLRGAKLPALIIWGREDKVVPLSAAEAYQRALPDARLEVLDHCGHRPELEQTERFVELVRGFLAGDARA